MNRLKPLLLTIALIVPLYNSVAQNLPISDTVQHPQINSEVYGLQHNYAVKPCRNSAWIVSGSLIVTGVGLVIAKNADELIINNYKIWEERNDHFKTFSNKADNYLQYAPMLTTFIVSGLGIKGKNDFPNQLALFVKSEMLMLSIVMPTKILVGEPRPDSGAKNSFPSGHTAQAFTVAAFLAKEYGYRSIWVKIGAYTMATAVGTMRILNDRHWVSDVLAGAGIGILSTNLVYATHKHHWGKKNKNLLTLSPIYSNKNAGLYFSYKF